MVKDIYICCFLNSVFFLLNNYFGFDLTMFICKYCLIFIVYYLISQHMFAHVLGVASCFSAQFFLGYVFSPSFWPLKVPFFFLGNTFKEMVFQFYPAFLGVLYREDSSAYLVCFVSRNGSFSLIILISK